MLVKYKEMFTNNRSNIKANFFSVTYADWWTGQPDSGWKKNEHCIHVRLFLLVVIILFICIDIAKIIFLKSKKQKF